MKQNLIFSRLKPYQEDEIIKGDFKLDTKDCKIEMLIDLIDNEIELKVLFPKDGKKGVYTIQENSKKRTEEHNSLELCLLSLLNKFTEKRDENIKMVMFDLAYFLVWR